MVDDLIRLIEQLDVHVPNSMLPKRAQLFFITRVNVGGAEIFDGRLCRVVR